MRAYRVLAIALSLCAAAASATVINFEPFPNSASGNTPVGTTYTSLGISFTPPTPGVAAGIANGDPGEWHVNGTNGPKVLAFGATNGRAMTITFADPQNYVSFDVAAAGTTAAGMTLSYTVWRGATTVYTLSRTLGAVNAWSKIEIPVGGLTAISWSAPNDFAVDNIVYRSNLVNGLFDRYAASPWRSTAADGSITWTNDEGDGRPDSGSTLVTNDLDTTVGGVAVVQCVAFPPQTAYTLKAKIKVAPSQQVTGFGQVAVVYFATTDCDSGISSTVGLSSTASAWTLRTLSAVTPIFTRSMKIILGAYKTGGVVAGTQFYVYFDSVVLTPRRSDFDATGSEDFVLRNYSTGQNALWLMNGTALSAIHDLPMLPAAYRIAGTADFNADGRPDLLLRNGSTGQNAVWLMQGTLVASIVDLPALPGLNWRIEGTGDFNSDGSPDILWRNSTTGQDAVWIMNGTSFSHVVDLPMLPNTNYAFESTGDFNGDGFADIALRNYTTGQNAVWLMNGTTLLSIVDLPALANPAYHIDALGDIDANTASDVVWRNYSTGQNAIWMMNGTSLGAIVDLPALPNTWYEINGPR